MKITTSRFALRTVAMCCVVAMACAAGVYAQKAATTTSLLDAVGHWQVINDDGKPGGQVETYLVEGKLFGKVTELKPGRRPGAVCEKCSGELKNKPILGMVFLKNFHQDGDHWVGGTAVDPDNGKEYKGKLWLAGKDTLYLRGYVGISMLGRTQAWKRITP